MTVMIRSVLLSLLLSPLCVESNQYYTYFTLRNDGSVTCSGNYIESATLSLDCEDEICPLGTTATLSGDVTVGNSGLPSEVASISLSASSFDIAYLEDLNMCEYLSGADCPDAGTYSISEYSIDLPDPSSSLSLAGSMGMAISVGADIYFDSGEIEQCSFTIALVNQSSGYSMGYIGMAGFMLFGVGTTLGVKRRKVATIQLDDTEGTHNHFELMPNEQTSVQV